MPKLLDDASPSPSSLPGGQYGCGRGVCSGYPHAKKKAKPWLGPSQSLTSLLPDCVPLGKLLNFSEPVFLPLKWEIILLLCKL